MRRGWRVRLGKKALDKTAVAVTSLDLDMLQKPRRCLLGNPQILIAPEARRPTSFAVNKRAARKSGPHCDLPEGEGVFLAGRGAGAGRKAVAWIPL